MREDSYSIQEIAAMTMLTERTIRSYLKQGFLCGEKSEGEWRFTTGAINNFLEQDTVRHSVAAKRNGILYSFLAEDDKTTSSTCQIFEFSCGAGGNGSHKPGLLRFDQHRALGKPPIFL